MTKRIMAITCYTGDEKLCEMTQGMIDELRSTAKGISLFLSVTAQGAERMVKSADALVVIPDNVSFAFGMNKAIDYGLRANPSPPDYVLVLNNDLRFPRSDWLAELVKAARPNIISVPRTDKTALRAYPGPASVGPERVQEMSAYCWLVPWGFCQWMKKTFKHWLFDEDFVPGRGEDNWASFLLSEKFGPNIFQVVHRSFVKHLRGQTSAKVKINSRKINQTLVAKLENAMKTRKLRPDLKHWAARLIKILKPRS